MHGVQGWLRVLRYFQNLLCATQTTWQSEHVLPQVVPPCASSMRMNAEFDYHGLAPSTECGCRRAAADKMLQLASQRCRMMTCSRRAKLVQVTRAFVFVC